MQNIILCGLGAVGLTYAVKIPGIKILVDDQRLEKLLKNKPLFNNVEQSFEYILPNVKFDADLVIIATKYSGLASALENIKNFVTSKTKIISLINGISTEEIIKSKYPQAKVLKSYFIGHTATRIGNSVTQDGVGEIVIEYDEDVCNFFEKLNINYSSPNDIDYSMWLKFTLNLFANQTSAILQLSFGEMKSNKYFIKFAKAIINEVKLIAGKKGISNLENLEKDALHALSLMSDDGKTSMYQDVLAKNKTEVDIYAGEIIRLGKLYGIPTPYNQILFDLIKIKEESFEYSVHSC